MGLALQFFQLRAEMASSSVALTFKKMVTRTTENLHRWCAGNENYTNPTLDPDGSGCGSLKDMLTVNIHLEKDMGIK